MSVKDMIKKSVLESEMYNQAISAGTILTILIDLAVAILCGMLIYFIYKKYYKGVVYSRNFALSLVGMTILTCMVTLAISTNVVISLGMVGALSIVRFRTAIKEPLDLMYLFWAITTGITTGASMYLLVLIAMIIMYVFIRLASRETRRGRTYLCIINYEGNETGDRILREFGRHKYTIRAKVLRGEAIEMTVQLRCSNDNMTFLEKINAMERVKHITLLESDGEYHA